LLQAIETALSHPLARQPIRPLIKGRGRFAQLSCFIRLLSGFRSIQAEIGGGFRGRMWATSDVPVVIRRLHSLRLDTEPLPVNECTGDFATIEGGLRLNISIEFSLLSRFSTVRFTS